MKPFLQGRKSLHDAPLKSGHVHQSGPAIGFVHPAQPSTGASPSVEVIKEGDKVVRLVVTCACGERIEVDCLYPAGG